MLFVIILLLAGAVAGSEIASVTSRTKVTKEIKVEDGQTEVLVKAGGQPQCFSVKKICEFQCSQCWVKKID